MPSPTDKNQPSGERGSVSYRQLSTMVYLGLLMAISALALGSLTPRTRPLATNTILLCSLTAAFTLPVALGLALLLSRVETPWRRLWLTIIAALLFFPLYLQAAGWNAGFGQLGWHTIWSDRVGSHWLTGWKAAIWLHTAAALPWATLIIVAGLRRATPMEDAARLEARPAAVLWHVTIPSAAPAIMTAGLWIIVSVAAEMTVADLFLIRTYAEELYTGFALEAGSPLSVVRSVLPSILGLACLSLATAVVVAQHASRWGAPVERAIDRPFVRGGVLAWLSVALVLAVFFGLPVGSLIWQAGADADGWSAAATVKQVAYAFVEFHREIQWSFIIAALTATTSLLVATPLAMWAARGSWRSWPALAVISLGLATPGPLWALFVLWILNRPVLEVLNDRTVAAAVMAISMRCLPLTIFVLWHALRTTPRPLLECARLEGATPWQQLRHVVLPLRSNALLVAWLLSCAVAIGDLAASILVMPPAVETAAIRLFGLIHSGVREQEASLALAMLIVCGVISTVGVALAYNGFQQRKSGKTPH